MGSRGRSSVGYRAARELFKTGRFTCWFDGCTRPGTTVDHDPPLASAPAPELWTGTYRPACPTCQARQGARIVNERRGVARPRSRQW